MSIVIDSALAAKFEGQSEETVVKTEDGRIVGLFTPVREGTAEDYAWAMAQVTEEEIQASLNSGPGRPLADILAELRRKYGP